MLDDLKQLRSLLSRVASAKSQDRRLDYEVFCLFSVKDHANIWDTHEGNDFTSTPILRHVTAIALHDRIRQAEALDA